jgi:hypothetical protein
MAQIASHREGQRHRAGRHPGTYALAETDRTFFNIATQAGGINRFFKIDQQTVMRMNKDTLYVGAIVDASKGATIAVPELPAGRPVRRRYGAAVPQPTN